MEAVIARTWHPERSAAWIIAVLVVVLAVFWQTTWSMVDLWESSGTYSHGYLILPAFVWLVWQRRSVLSSLPIQPFWPGVALLAGLGVTWLFGHLASANAPTQIAMLAMVPVSIATVLGTRWVSVLAFPLVFLFFAVPIGDPLVPHLMDWTADFTVAALKLSGIPVFREGNQFSIPSGDWSVVEACSGVRYVFACLTVATFFAWAVYRSVTRRLLFITVAVSIAIVANWIRAYCIVVVAHLSNNQLATGIDHFIYGGVFFGVVMAMVLGLGALWREDPADSESGSPDLPRIPAWATPTLRSGFVVLTVAAVLVVWPLLSLQLDGSPSATSARIAEIQSQGRWTPAQNPPASWKPNVSNPLQVQLQTFAKDGQRVTVHLATFGRPSADSKVTSSLNQLVRSDDRDWKLVQRGLEKVRWGDKILAFRRGTLHGQDVRITAWQSYWIDGILTSSSSRVALLQVLARLNGRSEMTALVTAFTHTTVDESSPVLEVFLSDMLGSIDQSLRAASSPVSLTAGIQ